MTDGKSTVIRRPHHQYAQLKPLDSVSGFVHSVIESPKGCQNKYKLNEEHGYFELHKVLPYGMFFPLDFGFVPGTRAADGDPLDVLVFMDEPTFTGCVAKVRLIGAITAEQRSKAVPQWTRNDRILAVSVVSHTHQKIGSIDDIDPNLLGELEQFFISYNKVQGKEFKIIDRVGIESAAELLEQAASNVRSENESK
ncbi:MAG TPA: inorganic diphosphatase [Drouetiella sp.]|jgi:inorganic pyrophosphatase